LEGGAGPRNEMRTLRLDMFQFLAVAIVIAALSVYVSSEIAETKDAARCEPLEARVKEAERKMLLLLQCVNHFSNEIGKEYEQSLETLGTPAPGDSD